ncbi:MAG: DUF975 domain-containing protein [Moorea sp. SIO4A1]|uniref:DUF975 domain-containing protein n=1 Tax=Moorena sp. SIO4A1 TaxID=2607835 RepID=UPI00144B1B70|nr:DUF975 domain-containing protein [Moorena sp. SIO4A1]NEQ59724.1 DUF975 domain-containing protein [Moorena sp. SIO4A1]
MSYEPSPNQSLGPLSIGNVVNVGLRIYRDHFKLYYRLAFIGYLWLLVPIYGWAKFSAMFGLISRLAFREIIERPETVNEARSHVNPRMWSFLRAGILVSLITFGVAILVSLIIWVAIMVIIVIISILIGVLASISGNSSTILDSLDTLPENSVAMLIIGFLVLSIFMIAFFFGFIWFISRLLIYEIPLAIENPIGARAAIGRSWKLTQGFILRIQGIVVVGFLISLPISIAVQIATFIIQTILSLWFPQDSAIFIWLYLVLVFGLSFASGALLVPFWQAIKSVIYYDLCSRKEGIDLQLWGS